jgi:hypothetical protein
MNWIRRRSFLTFIHGYILQTSEETSLSTFSTNPIKRESYAVRQVLLNFDLYRLITSYV